MPTRRDFLKGLFASVAAGVLVKNGVMQPERIIGIDRAGGADHSTATVFDMAANTWREQEYTFRAEGWQELKRRLGYLPLLRPPISKELLADIDAMGGYLVPYNIAELISQPLGDQGFRSRDYYFCLDNFGISSDAVAKRIRELTTRTEVVQAYRTAVLEEGRRWENEILYGVPGKEVPAGVIRLDDGNPT